MTSPMADPLDDKDVLLEKLDNLMQSGRFRRRRDPPPVLTDAIPTADDSAIPTLTEAVEVPGSAQLQQPEQPRQQAEQTAGDLDTPLEFEPGTPVTSKPQAPAEAQQVGDTALEPEEPNDRGEERREDFAQTNPVDLQQTIASRLVAVLDREMAGLTETLPGHKSKLTALHRSLRFALPELVRLRWQDSESEESKDSSEGPSEADR